MADPLSHDSFVLIALRVWRCVLRSGANICLSLGLELESLLQVIAAHVVSFRDQGLGFVIINSDAP